MKIHPTKRQVVWGLIALVAGSLLSWVGAQPEPPAPPLPQVRVSCEWIALPHLEANRLLRSHASTPKRGNAMHEAAQRLVASGKAKILQQQVLQITSGEKAQTGTLRHFPYPNEFNPPQIPTKVIVQGGNVIQGNFRKVEPAALQGKNLGFKLEVDASVDDTYTLADLSVAAEWTTHADDQVWGQGLAEVTQPVFQNCAFSAQAFCEHDTWTLVAQLRPTATSPGAAGLPLADERVLVFIKPFIEGHGPPAPLKREKQQAQPEDPFGSGPIRPIKEIGVLYEWIELDTADVDLLMDRIPASGRTETLRAAVQPLVDTGKATLMESTYVIVRNGGSGSKAASVLEFPYPTEFDPPNLPQTILELPAPVPPLPITRPVFWPTPTCPQSFEFKNLGTTVNPEVTASVDGTILDLNDSPAMVRLIGIQTHGQGVSQVSQPRFATLTSATQILLKNHQSALVDSFEAMPEASVKTIPSAATLRGNPGRRILLFVTAGMQ